MHKLFKTPSGQQFQANLFTLFFEDKNLESSYKNHLAVQSLPLFALQSIVGCLWSVLLTIIYHVTNTPSATGNLSVALTSIISFLVFFGLTRSRLFVRYIYMTHFELVFFIAQLLTIDWSLSVSVLCNDMLKLNISYFAPSQWISTLIVTEAICARRRIPVTILSTSLSIFFDLLAAISLRNSSLVELFQDRIAVDLTGLITAIIFVYQSEITCRSFFLSQREIENWRIDRHELVVKELIGRSWRTVQLSVNRRHRLVRPGFFGYTSRI